MNRIEYWLLESAIEYIHEFEVILNDEVRSSSNLRPHDCSREEVVDALVHLINTGDLIASNNLSNIYGHESVIKTQIEIEAALDDGENWFYYLTPQGGAKWETVSKVDWSKCSKFGDPPYHIAGEFINERKEKGMRRIHSWCSYIQNYGGFELILSKLEATAWLSEYIDLDSVQSNYEIVDECESDLTLFERETLKTLAYLDDRFLCDRCDLMSFTPDEWGLDLRAISRQKDFEEDLFGTNRDLLKQILSLRDFLLFGIKGSLVPESEVWEIVEQWRPTYWKVLPSAHRVRYKVKPILENSPEDPYNRDWRKQVEAEKWYRQATKWYTPLFEY